MTDFFSLNTYDYHLPMERIAQNPLPDRSSSRLLILDKRNASISHHHFWEAVDFLQAGDVLVLNTSKVFPARLFGKKENGTSVEVFLLHCVEANFWQCMIHPGKRIKHPQSLWFSDTLQGFIGDPDEEGLRIIELISEGELFDEFERIGHVPLPPYIHRDDNLADHQNYQTVYAEQLGSVAAPTAGFHFTSQILNQLKDKGVIILNVLLHVGIGTFRPVKTDSIKDHKMHSEFCTIEPDVAAQINLAKAQNRRVVAVGTTSVRTLESFYNPDTQSLESGNKWTDIFLYPGKSFHIVDALFTNFHLPKSTLIMLVAAFAGYDITMRAYAEAIEKEYRFFSYGDAMFIH